MCSLKMPTRPTLCFLLHQQAEPRVKQPAADEPEEAGVLQRGIRAVAQGVMGQSCPWLLPLPLKEHLSLAFLQGDFGLQADPAYRCLCPIRVLLNGVYSRASICEV